MFCSLPDGKKLKERRAGIGDLLKEDYNCTVLFFF